MSFPNFSASDWLIIALLVIFSPVVIPMAMVVGIFLWSKNAKEKLNRTGTSLNALASYRDGFLLLVAASYGIGYVVWSLHAWKVGAGILPALRFQYVFAGIVPLVLGAVVVKLTSLLIRIRSSPLAKPLNFAATVVMTTVVAIFILKAGLGPIAVVLFLALTIIVMASGASFGAIGTAAVTLPWNAGTLVATAIGVYAFVFYPLIPQALGGVRPECVTLDIKAAELSSDSRLELGAADPSATDTVRRTGDLDLLFAGDDFLLVRSRGHDRPASSVHRLDKSAVTSVVRC